MKSFILVFFFFSCTVFFSYFLLLLLRLKRCLFYAQNYRECFLKQCLHSDKQCSDWLRVRMHLLQNEKKYSHLRLCSSSLCPLLWGCLSNIPQPMLRTSVLSVNLPIIFTLNPLVVLVQNILKGVPNNSLLILKCFLFEAGASKRQNFLYLFFFFFSLNVKRKTGTDRQSSWQLIFWLNNHRSSHRC